MRFPAPKHHFLKWVLSFLFFLQFFFVGLSDPRTSEVSLVCGSSPSPLGSDFVPVFVSMMENLSNLVAANQWGVSEANSTFGLAQCHSDLSPTDCQLCFAACHDAVPRCLPSARAHIFLDGCFLRYDDHRFYGESLAADLSSAVCGGALVPGSGFEGSVGLAVGNATARAAGEGGGFGVGEARGVYALAQCWETVSADGCRGCLEEAAVGVRGCARNSTEGRGLNAGCYLRYSTQKFYSDGLGHGDGDGDGSFGRGSLIAVVLCGFAVLMLSLFAGYAAYTKLAKAKAERNNIGRISNHFNKSSLSFKYETLEKATDYFSPTRKLGQGGAGSVYKGTLPDGKVVAVKRLVFNTKQWVDEFFNEVNLISGIKHKNLVKLLGCSIEGPESLLVYEYVKNKSLDQFIFDEQKVKTLTWKHRFSIIVGTAEGLAYLHEGLEVRIIHRDIKGSNVLLDENLAPKIADFGLARSFAADRSHLSTGIAGTLGYMAPEYLVKGQLTEKADVYSFGVLLLEIVSGRRNFSFTKDSGSLLQTVWGHYMSNTLFESIDPALRDDFPEKESTEVLRIGLLCTQASAALRPSMAEVVQMMTDKTQDIPKPCQPPFMKSSRRGSSCSMGSYTINSLDSNLNTLTESSDSSRTPMVSTVLDIKELKG